MHPHVHHIPLLHGVLGEDGVDVVGSRLHLEPSSTATINAVSRADNVGAIHNGSPTGVEMVRRNIQVLERYLPRELVRSRLLASNYAGFHSEALLSGGGGGQ